MAKRLAFFLSLCCMFILLMGLTVPMLMAHEGAERGGHHHAEPVNPRSGFWRQVREGVAGYTAVTGQETGVLIQGSGQNWRQLRNGPITAFGGALLGFVVFALAAIYHWRGPLRLNRPRTGQTLERWTRGERMLHWYTAILFLWLALTGLSLLYGRVLLIPLIGRESFAAWAGLAKLTHNIVGPLFMVGLLWMILVWTKYNLPNRIDIEWIKAFGGMIGHKHPSAGRLNAGEKAWFWLLVFGGLLLSWSGLVLDFPNVGQERWVMQISHLVHVGCALLLIAGALGHIYMGSVGTEGALEGMITGKVDRTWALQHHDLWYRELTDRPRNGPPTPQR